MSLIELYRRTKNACEKEQRQRSRRNTRVREGTFCVRDGTKMCVTYIPIPLCVHVPPLTRGPHVQMEREPMTHCPCCGHHLPEPAPRPDPVELLRQQCFERGFPIFSIDRIREDAAAVLTGRAIGTLRNWRIDGEALPFIKTRGRVSYRLQDIADFLELDSDE